MVDDTCNSVVAVIIPVYQAEAYIEKCLDSVLAQTWEKLVLILVDDGSSDRSGEICDRYAEKDARVRVYHTENRGPGAARNIGIQKALEMGTDYFAFADSDDWIEPGMIETLTKTALDSGADIVICGEFWEDDGKTRVVAGAKTGEYTGLEALKANLRGRIGNHLMNKLWDKACFETIRIPEDRRYEDVSIVYRLLGNAERVICIDDVFYHYVQREGSITHVPSLRNLTDYMKVMRELYEFAASEKDLAGDEALLRDVLRRCAHILLRAWRYAYSNPKEELQKYRPVFKEMARFSRKTIPLLGMKGWPLQLRLGTLLTRHASAPHFLAGHLANQLWLNKSSEI